MRTFFGSGEHWHWLYLCKPQDQTKIIFFSSYYLTISEWNFQVSNLNQTWLLSQSRGTRSNWNFFMRWLHLTAATKIQNYNRRADRAAIQFNSRKTNLPLIVGIMNKNNSKSKDRWFNRPIQYSTWVNEASHASKSITQASTSKSKAKNKETAPFLGPFTTVLFPWHVLDSPCLFPHTFSDYTPTSIPSHFFIVISIARLDASTVDIWIVETGRRGSACSAFGFNVDAFQ